MKEKRKHPSEPSIQGVAFVHRLFIESMQYFNKAYDLSMTQSNVVLMLCFYKHLTLTELCDHTGLNKSTASRTVDGLVERGMVERIIPKENRRIIQLKLTGTFAEKLGKIQEDKEFQELLTKDVPTERTALVIKKLDELLAVIQGRELPKRQEWMPKIEK